MAGVPRMDNKKPTTVRQPWVLVEIRLNFDKRLRRRQLRRRPAAQLADKSLTLAVNLVREQKESKLLFAET
jgi:hypothetical protein